MSEICISAYLSSWTLVICVNKRESIASRSNTITNYAIRLPQPVSAPVAIVDATMSFTFGAY